MQRLDLDRVIEMANDPLISGQEFVTQLRDALDVGHIAFMMLRLPGFLPHKSNFGYSTYPDNWLSCYVQNGYWACDPAICLALKRTSAFGWEEMEPSQELEAMWEDAMLHHISPLGFTIPVHGPLQETSILSVSAKWNATEIGLEKKYRSRLIRDLMPVATVLHDRLLGEIGFNQDRSPQLSPILTHAEREVLSWVSLGKTAWETAKILGKSKKTVEFQLAACRQKLGATTTAHAVTKAVATGLIEENSGKDDD